MVNTTPLLPGLSAVGGKAVAARFDSATRDEMLARTYGEDLPRHVVRADDKKAARLNVIRHLMSRVECPDKDEHLARPDLRWRKVVFDHAEHYLRDGAIAP